jgi:hypothetical protein
VPARECEEVGTRVTESIAIWNELDVAIPPDPSQSVNQATSVLSGDTAGISERQMLPKSVTSDEVPEERENLEISKKVEPPLE